MDFSKAVAAVVAVAVFGLAVFLETPAPPEGDAGGTHEPAAVVQAPELSRPTKEQAAAFAAQFRTAWLSQDEEAGAEMYDLAKGAELALAGEVVPDSTMRDLRSATDGAGALAIRTLGMGLDGDSNVRLIRFEEEDYGVWAYFGVVKNRTYDQVGVLLAVVGTKIQIVDTWSLQDGRPMSATLRETAFSEPVSVSDLATMRAMMEARDAQDWQRAIATFNAASPRVQKMRAPQLLRIVAAGHLSDPRRAEYINTFLVQFPDDSSAMFQAMRLERAAGNPVGVAESMEQLHDLAGPDAYLLVAASQWWLVAGEVESARSTADEALRVEPAMEAAWLQHLQVVRIQGDAMAEAATAAVLSDRFGLDATKVP